MMKGTPIINHRSWYRHANQPSDKLVALVSGQRRQLCIELLLLNKENTSTPVIFGAGMETVDPCLRIETVDPCLRIQLKFKLHLSPGSFNGKEFLLKHGLGQQGKGLIKLIIPCSDEKASLIILHTSMKEGFRLQRLYPQKKPIRYTHNGQLTRIKLEEISFVGKLCGGLIRKDEMDDSYSGKFCLQTLYHISVSHTSPFFPSVRFYTLPDLHIYVVN